MRGARAAFAALALVAGTPASATAQEPDRQVLLFLVDEMSFEEALTDPLLASLRAGGGVGLMTTLRGEERGRAAYLSIAAGRTASRAPTRFGGILFLQDQGLLLDDDPIPPPRRPIGIGSILRRAGRTVGYLDMGSALGHPAMLVAADRQGRIPVAFLNEFAVLGSLSEAILGNQAKRVLDTADLVVSPGLRSLRFALDTTPAEEVLVLVVAPSASGEMRARGDLVTPLLMDQGSPQDVLSGAGSSGLTSNTTRRQGIVSNVDVAPTVLEFLGVRAPDQMVGSSIRFEGEPPIDFHERYLEYRRTQPPVGVAALLLAIASLLAGLTVLAVRRLARLRVVVAVWVLGSVGALVALQPASLLPTFELPVVALTFLAVAGLLTGAGLWAGRGDPFVPVAVMAGIGLAVEALDALFGWPTGLTPLLSGGALEGVRFYGLGNSYAGIVLGGAVLVAARLSRPGVGTGLIAAAAAFAGLPFIGADLGGGLALFAAAAIWFGLRHPVSPPATRWSLAAAIFLAGALSLLAAHRLFPEGAPHIARAAGDGLGGVLGAFLDRLGTNLRTTAAAPAAWLALAGVPVWLVVAWRGFGPFRPPLEADPAWRDAVITLSLGAIFGYVLNDTFGMAAVAFVFVSAAMVYPALRWNAR